jgi:hypothetical protein
MPKCSWCGNEVKEYAVAELCRTCSEADLKPVQTEPESSVNVEAGVIKKTVGMTVNLNNLRRQAVFAYDRLCHKLNDAIKKEWDGYSRITILADDLQSDMDTLRNMLVTLACVFEEGDDDFKDLAEEIGDVEVFNNEEC